MFCRILIPKSQLLPGTEETCAHQAMYYDFRIHFPEYETPSMSLLEGNHGLGKSYLQSPLYFFFG